MADARLVKISLSLSISVARALIDFLCLRAICLNENQKSFSSETLVRCPFIVSERFTGRMSFFVQMTRM